MAKDNNETRDDARAIEADIARRKAAGVPYEIAQRLAKRQAEMNKKGAKK